jgi:hypothetical protein
VKIILPTELRATMPISAPEEVKAPSAFNFASPGV